MLIQRGPIGFYCGLTGHMIRECPAKYQHQQRNKGYHFARKNSNSPHFTRRTGYPVVQSSNPQAPSTTANNNNTPNLNHHNAPVNTIMHVKSDLNAIKNAIEDKIEINSTTPKNTDIGITHTKIINGFINGSINNMRVSILIDTGASVSCIHPDLYYQLASRNKEGILTNSKHPLIIGISGEETPILGSIKLRLKIRKFSTEFSFQVVNIGKYQIILGRDFLEKNKAVINFFEKTITLKNKHILGVTPKPHTYMLPRRICKLQKNFNLKKTTRQGQ